MRNLKSKNKVNPSKERCSAENAKEGLEPFLEKQKNIRSFSISSNILRVETAPVVALAKLN